MCCPLRILDRFVGCWNVPLPRTHSNCARKERLTTFLKTHLLSVGWRCSTPGARLGIRSWHTVGFSRRELYDLIVYPHPRLLHDVIESMHWTQKSHSTAIFICRPPSCPTATRVVIPWHQDSQYYGAPTRALKVITVTVPLVDVTEDNGCLWMAPGSHTWELWPGTPGHELNQKFEASVRENNVPTVACPMNAGDVMPFSNLTFHTSFKNTSQTIRWTVDLRYSPTPGSREMTAAEQSGYDYFLPRLQSLGYTQFVARSRRRPADSWQTWQAEHLRRNNNDLSRLNRYL